MMPSYFQLLSVVRVWLYEGIDLNKSYKSNSAIPPPPLYANSAFAACVHSPNISSDM